MKSVLLTSPVEIKYCTSLKYFTGIVCIKEMIQFIPKSMHIHITFHRNFHSTYISQVCEHMNWNYLEIRKKMPFSYQFLYIINNFGEGGNSCSLNIDCMLVWGRFCILQRHIYPLLFPEDGSLNTSWVDKNSSFVLKIEKDKRKWKT